MNRLNVLQEEVPVSRSQRRQGIQSKFESLWRTGPEQFNPDRSAMERERIERTWSLLAPQVQAGILALDLPCGWGVLSQRLKSANAQVHASDVASIPLE